MKVVIVGGVAGGASAAARLRRLDEKAEIVIFERSEFISYANCGLPYYIGDVIVDKNELTLQTPESFYERFHIQVKVKHEVLAIHRENKTVSVRDLMTGKEWEEPYDKLILSPGAKAIVPPLPGIDNYRIFTLRNVEDSHNIHYFIANYLPKRAVVIGGGFIGLEMAENLTQKGLHVTVVERVDYLMKNLDPDMASFVHNKLQEKGIDLLLKTEVTGFRQEGETVITMLKKHEEIVSDMVIMAVGVAPEANLAKAAGLQEGIRGSIYTDEHMQTSDPDIYAVGDAVQVQHYITKEDSLIYLAGPANKQGRVAADNICGIKNTYNGALGSSVLKLFDLTVASTGITEEAAKRNGLKFDSVVLSPASHATYYPGAKVMTMKVIFEKHTLALLGAQIIGSEGVDKRIDVLSTAIYAGMKADKLKDLDLAYAPPFSSAKDPVNMVGFMIENIDKGLVKQYHWYEEKSLSRDGSVTLLDARTTREYARGHIDGYKNIPVDELRNRLDEIDPTKPVYVICQSGIRSYIACRILTQNGFDCYNFSGGYHFYSGISVPTSFFVDRTIP